MPIEDYNIQRSNIYCLLRLSRKEDELRVLQEELREKTARWSYCNLRFYGVRHREPVNGLNWNVA